MASFYVLITTELLWVFVSVLYFEYVFLYLDRVVLRLMLHPILFICIKYVAVDAAAAAADDDDDDDEKKKVYKLSCRVMYVTADLLFLDILFLILLFIFVFTCLPK